MLNDNIKLNTNINTENKCINNKFKLYFIIKNQFYFVSFLKKTLNVLNMLVRMISIILSLSLSLFNNFKIDKY